jgi:5'(3')-deoxyribonucleotidase
MEGQDSPAIIFSVDIENISKDIKSMRRSIWESVSQKSTEKLKNQFHVYILQIRMQFASNLKRADENYKWLICQVLFSWLSIATYLIYL